MRRRQPTPPLPLSPISNPSSPPPRKRARTANWDPPPHIPSFLPPFPTNSTTPPLRTPSPPPRLVASPEPQNMSPMKVERPESPIPEISTSIASADYLTPVPYSLSSLSGVPAWHLPTKPRSPPPPINPSNKLPIPQIQPALFGAYHHVLTHPPPPTVTTTNPGRYKVALALVHQAEVNPRWDPPSTLFASSVPNTPRVAPIGPSYAVPIARTFPGEKEKESGGSGKDKGKESEAETRLPPAPPRPVGSFERPAPLINQQSSRIPSLAKQMLPGSVYSRTTRLTHPPVLQQSGKKLTYGNGVNAPWNVGPLPSTTAATPAPALPTKETKSGSSKDAGNAPNGKDAVASKALPDARLFATWDWEHKSYSNPLQVGRRRMGSMHVSSSGHGFGNGILLGGPRPRSESKG